MDTQELNSKLAAVKTELPEGFSIVETAPLQQLINERKACLALLRKIEPLFGLVGGGGTDIMGLIPKIMPSITAMQGDTELAGIAETVMNILKAETGK